MQRQRESLFQRRDGVWSNWSCIKSLSETWYQLELNRGRFWRCWLVRSVCLPPLCPWPAWEPWPPPSSPSVASASPWRDKRSGMALMARNRSPTTVAMSSHLSCSSDLSPGMSSGEAPPPSSTTARWTLRVAFFLSSGSERASSSACLRAATAVEAMWPRATQRNFLEAPGNRGRGEIFRAWQTRGLFRASAGEQYFSPLPKK
jgi:hypothetical protein